MFYLKNVNRNVNLIIIKLPKFLRRIIFMKNQEAAKSLYWHKKKNLK